MAPAPNIPLAKRAGLPVDLERMRTDGDTWLTPEERYALKTFGVCTQLQDGVFMIRMRVPGGALSADQLEGLAGIAERWAAGWLHLTTRQNVELHHVAATDVPDVLDALAGIGLSSRSACGHTLRNVMACPDAGVGLDEPFDCYPDARLVSDAIVARSAALNCQLPSRLNVTFGGCPSCREHARINDLSFVSVVRGGRAGYEVWAGGSLGVNPMLGLQVRDFVPREEALAIAEAIIDLFITHGDIDSPKRARLKFVVDDLGEERFRALFEDHLAVSVARARPEPPPVDVLADADVASVLAAAPPGGWAPGIRPQRVRGRATMTVNIPMGDLDGDDARALTHVTRHHADGFLTLTRNQNVALRDVPCADVPLVARHMARHRLGVEGVDGATDVRACTGSAVCSLAITASPTCGAGLLAAPALARNSALRVHISGCPNSCAQHQAADIGLSGAKVRIAGKTRLGYHLWLGADLDAGVLADVVGRVAEEDVPLAVEAVVGIWEAMRRPREALGDTVTRIGADAFAARIAALVDGWETGPEDDDQQPSARALAFSAP